MAIYVIENKYEIGINILICSIIYQLKDKPASTGIASKREDIFEIEAETDNYCQDAAEQDGRAYSEFTVETRDGS